MQTPFAICIPGPQAWRTSMNASLGACSGARGSASAADTSANASNTTIHLTMIPLLSGATAHRAPLPPDAFNGPATIAWLT